MSVKNVEEFMQTVNKLRAEEIDSWLNLVFAATPKFAASKGYEAISLKEFVETIKKVYSSFKEEYQELGVLNIGQGSILESYEENKHYYDRKLVIAVDKEQNKNTLVPWMFSSRFFITEKDGELRAFFLKGTLKYDIKKISQETLKKYLDLFGKYYPLFQLAKSFNDIFQVGFNRYLQISFDTENGSLIDNLNGIKITLIERDKKGVRYLVNVYVDVKDEIKIDYSKCFAKVLNNDVDYDVNQTYDTVLNSLCVSVDDLNYDLISGLAKEDDRIR